MLLGKTLLGINSAREFGLQVITQSSPHAPSLATSTQQTYTNSLQSFSPLRRVSSSTGGPKTHTVTTAQPKAPPNTLAQHLGDVLKHLPHRVTTHAPPTARRPPLTSPPRSPSPIAPPQKRTRSPSVPHARPNVKASETQRPPRSRRHAPHGRSSVSSLGVPDTERCLWALLKDGIARLHDKPIACGGERERERDGMEDVAWTG